MADVKGLLADPRFQALSPEDQRLTLGRVDARFSGLSPADFQTFLSRVKPTEKPAEKKPPGLGESILQAGSDVLEGIGSGVLSTVVHGGDIVRRGLGMKRVIQEPGVQALIRPPESTAGKIGRAGEQGAEFFLPIPGGGKLKALRGAGGVLARTGAEALRAGAVTGAQTGSGSSAALGAGAGAAGGLVGEAAQRYVPKIAQSLYKGAIRPGKMGLPQQAAAVGKGVKAELPVAEASLDPLQTEITRFKSQIHGITRDPVYGQRTVPIDSILDPVDKYIARIRPGDRAGADALQAVRDEWATSLGYQPATPAKSITSPILAPGGHPIVHTIPGTPAQTLATLEDAQVLKESLATSLKSTSYAPGAEPGSKVVGRKVAEHSLKQTVEKVVPEEPIQAINHVISTDINLKKSITQALLHHPTWMRDWGSFILGTAMAHAAGSALGASEGLALGGATATGLLIRAAARSPTVMSRLAIALDKAGVPVAQALGRGVPVATGAILAPVPGGTDQ